MVTQATSQAASNTLPPSSRDFEAYRLVKVERKSTRAVAKLLRISQTRVCQIVERVAEYLVEVTQPESEARREQQLAVAKQVAAEQIDYCIQRAVHSYDRSCGEVRTIREVENPAGQITRTTTTRENFGETRYLTTIARLAVIGSTLPICTLPIAVRRTADAIQADVEDCNIEDCEVEDCEVEEVANPSKVDCSAPPREQACAEPKLPAEFAETLEAIRIYNQGMQMLNLPERQILEPVHPAESVPFERRPLTKLERKRLRRDQRKQRSAVAMS